MGEMPSMENNKQEKIVKYNKKTGEVYVPYTHIFYCFNYKDDKVDMFVADDEYKKFQTVEQFLAGEGESKVTVKASPFKKRTNKNIKCYSPSGKMLMSIAEANSDEYISGWPLSYYKGYNKEYLKKEYGVNYWIGGDRSKDEYYHSIRNKSDFKLLLDELNKTFLPRRLGPEHTEPQKIIKYQKETNNLYVPYTHIFYCFNYKDNKVEIYIADDEYKKFQTRKQFLNDEGESKVTIKASPFKKRTNRNIKCYSPSGKMLMSIEEANSDEYISGWPLSYYKDYNKEYLKNEYGVNYWVGGEFMLHDKYYHSVRNLSHLATLSKKLNERFALHKRIRSKNEIELVK